MSMPFTVRVDHGDRHSVHATGPYRVEKTDGKVILIIKPEGGGEQSIELEAGESAYVMNSQGWTVDIIRNKRPPATLKTTRA